MQLASVEFLVILLFVFLVSIAFYQVFGRYFIGYRIGGERIEIRLFHTIPLYMFSKDCIEGAFVVPIRRVLSVSEWKDLFSLGAANRLTGDAILIYKKGWLIRKVIITPDDPQLALDIITTRT